MQRSIDDLNVRCSADGFTPNGGTAPSDVKTLFLGNAIFGGLIGGAVDVGDGSAYDYPSTITVNLQPASTAVLAGIKPR